jgi:ATP-dependent RNA helicase DDX56/DBP9
MLGSVSKLYGRIKKLQAANNDVEVKAQEEVEVCLFHRIVAPKSKQRPLLFSIMADPILVDSKATFTSFSHILDTRILRALADIGFARPTLVQAKAIPLALESRDILARARTGSGKTAAYCIPVVQKILSAKSVGGSKGAAHDIWLIALQSVGAIQATRALILVPTRELSEQVSAYLRGLLTYCEDEISISNLAAGTTTHLQRCVFFFFRQKYLN